MLAILPLGQTPVLYSTTRRLQSWKRHHLFSSLSFVLDRPRGTIFLLYLLDPWQIARCSTPRIFQHPLLIKASQPEIGRIQDLGPMSFRVYDYSDCTQSWYKMMMHPSISKQDDAADVQVSWQSTLVRIAEFKSIRGIHFEYILNGVHRNAKWSSAPQTTEWQIDGHFCTWKSVSWRSRRHIAY